MNSFQPWTKYPDLTPDRLSTVAEIIRRARRETVTLHDAPNGDNEWSLGCRAYARTCHGIREAAKYYEWLQILPEAENLRFSFAIGSVPFRFYTGKPGEPPGHYLIATYGELHQQQFCLAIDGLRPIDKILRFAVEVDAATREVLRVTFVEVDDAGNITETYPVPFDGQSSKVAPIQVRPVELPPPVVESLEAESRPEEHKKAE